MLNKDLKKEIISIIIFTVCLIFAFIYIKQVAIFIKGLLTLITPFIIGLVIAFVLNILVNFLDNKLFNKTNIKESRTHSLSIILSLAIVFSFITFLLLLIIPQIKNTTNLFIENMPTYQENVIDLLDKIGLNNEVRAKLINSSKEFGDTLTSYLKNNKDMLITNALGIATNVVTGIVNISIGIIFAIYLLVEKERLLRQTNKLLNAYLPENKVTKIKSIAHISNKTFASFASGQFIEAFIIGFLCLIGMLILRIPYSITISILVGFTALIPVFGAFIGTGIGAFLIFMINPLKALIFIIFILILQQIEGNLIYPKVMSKRVNLPGIWVLVAVTIGASIYGIVGMLLSVPIASITYSIIATNVNERLKEKTNAPKTRRKVKTQL